MKDVPRSFMNRLEDVTSVLRTEEASRMRGETSSLLDNRIQLIPDQTLYLEERLMTWKPSQTCLSKVLPIFKCIDLFKQQFHLNLQ